MKYLVISDIHGSLYYLKQVIDIFDKEGFDRLIILGDVYYHGPRNPLPKDYDPMGVASLLNSMKDKLIAIKGNCDAEVDEMISEFKFKTSVSMKINDLVFYIHHGHKDIIMKKKYDYVLKGHTHVLENQLIGETRILNPGSISLPKDDNGRNYIEINEQNIKIIDLLTRELKVCIELN